ncbi:hypothetical protein [Paenibacillus eucommiae]|uniref:Uncharacterized protein n=1 Tax=Paenibacillus eucommiae TaxID=1355755 RepID=A0ABS4J229_9BACL|nr:hypothetical protein [Paenibacillus eucommiae]MBP1993873.1 hypothetical protein [Paenibacillus eucommiae]
MDIFLYLEKDVFFYGAAGSHIASAHLPNERVLDLTMFFIVKVRLWRRPTTLTMKNIAKVATLHSQRLPH